MSEKVVRVFVLGVSGSIGAKVLERINHLNGLKKSTACRFEVVGVAAYTSLEAVVKAAGIETVEAAVLTEPRSFLKAKREHSFARRRSQGNVACVWYDSIREAMESTQYDVLVNALVGSIGLEPTFIALSAGKKVLLANKESLVVGGELLKKKFSTDVFSKQLIPIDSEHSAILHLLHIANSVQRPVSKLIITASGGPFFKNLVKNPTVAQALAHPNWSMGKKISIDSATMMNKGLEVIEAHYFFQFAYENIEVLVHPQSIVHSLVETVDGEQYAQIGPAEMGFAIQNALTYPQLQPTGYPSFSLTQVGKLEFHACDFSKFPLLKLAYECGKKKGTHLAVLNAANEIAVKLFLAGKIEFAAIARVVERCVEKHTAFEIDSIQELIALDKEVKTTLESEWE